MPKQTFGSIDKFRDAARDNDEPLVEAEVRQSFDTEVKALDSGRAIRFTISTASVDRMGDTINVDGWDVEAYVKNPVVLWQHNPDLLPLGKATKIWKEDGKLKADAEFTPLGMLRFNDTVYEMLKAGFLNATSVGFQPIKYSFSEDPQRRFGIDFHSQSLLEFSVVGIPANPEALVEAKSAGIDIEPMIDHHVDQILRSGTDRMSDILGRLAEKAGMAVVSKERIERIERAATAQRIAAAKAARARDLDLVRIKSF